jgi:inosine-uridine nucleoside N-ribohydrolase
LQQVATKTAEDGSLLYPRKVQTSADLPEAVDLLRKTLARQEDHSVVLIMVGFSTNIARLLQSSPDEYSPLKGTDLVKQKARLLSMMGGKFLYPEFESGDYNVVMDPDAARVVFEKWPGKIVASGCALGAKVLYPVSSINQDFHYVEHHPVADAYHFYIDKDRESWDLTSVLYAVEPDAGYFDLSYPGQLVVDRGNEGRWLFLQEGNHFYLSADPEQLRRMRDRFIELASAPPYNLGQ